MDSTRPSCFSTRFSSSLSSLPKPARAGAAALCTECLPARLKNASKADNVDLSPFFFFFPSRASSKSPSYFLQQEVPSATDLCFCKSGFIASKSQPVNYQRQADKESDSKNVLLDFVFTIFRGRMDPMYASSVSQKDRSGYSPGSRTKGIP